MNKKVVLGFMLAGVAIICIPICGLTFVTTFIFPGDPVSMVPSIEASEPTQRPLYQIEPEPLEEGIVFVICEECINADEALGSLTLLMLWETPDVIGNHGPTVAHGDRCLLLENAVSLEGIPKSLVRCKFGEGWIRSGALSSMPPEGE